MPLGIHLLVEIAHRTALGTVRCTPPRLVGAGECRCDITLRLIRYIDRYVIEEEVSVAIACDIDHTNAEVRVAEIACSPSATPCIRGAPKGVGRFCGGEVCRLLGSCPVHAAVP